MLHMTHKTERNMPWEISSVCPTLHALCRKIPFALCCSYCAASQPCDFSPPGFFPFWHQKGGKARKYTLHLFLQGHCSQALDLLQEITSSLLGAFLGEQSNRIASKWWGAKEASRNHSHFYSKNQSCRAPFALFPCHSV